MLQVRDAFWRGVCPEGHEGAQQLRVGACHRNVEFCGSCRHAGHLHVDGRIGEDKAAPAQEHSVATRALSRVTCEARTLTFWMLESTELLASAGSAKLDLPNKVELRREHLAAAQEPDEGGRHEDFLKVRLRQGVGEAADFVDLEALFTTRAASAVCTGAPLWCSCRCRPCAGRWRKAEFSKCLGSSFEREG